MTEMLETIAIGFSTQISEKCPFVDKSVAGCSEEEENVGNDDRRAVRSIQANSGGVLGENLIAARPGAPGTINNIYPPPKAESEKPVDTKRYNGGRVKVKDDDFAYPYMVAAHHLVPGNAALAKSSLYKMYMKKGGKPRDKANSQYQYEIQENIGYNVNGAHNGVWLPGNYAIRRKAKNLPASIKGKSWVKMMQKAPDWCFNYMVAVVKSKGAQFHDSHVEYSEKVLEYLEKICISLLNHHQACKQCKRKKEIPPPYSVKTRLYAFSKALLGKVRGHPSVWSSPWITSDRFKPLITGVNKKKFIKAYQEAQPWE
jgi:A nuclease family of the HNH/ENDO VII superfamily with conserved AHH